mmetsp:Transcript_5727/g.12404  ORF Transcript_5727/g.12404 Transcript_5727/m.12404 type:complete len:223 (-) Transcript_5727:127-795(-)
MDKRILVLDRIFSLCRQRVQVSPARAFPWILTNPIPGVNYLGIIGRSIAGTFLHIVILIGEFIFIIRHISKRGVIEVRGGPHTIADTFVRGVRACAQGRLPNEGLVGIFLRRFDILDVELRPGAFVVGVKHVLSTACLDQPVFFWIVSLVVEARLFSAIDNTRCIDIGARASIAAFREDGGWLLFILEVAAAETHCNKLECILFGEQLASLLTLTRIGWVAN